MLLIPWLSAIVMVAHLHAIPVGSQVAIAPQEAAEIISKAVSSLEDSLLNQDFGLEKGRKKNMPVSMSEPVPPLPVAPSLSGSNVDPLPREIHFPNGTSEEIKPLLKILKQAEYNLEDEELFDDQTMASLPKWSEIQQLYGPPKIFGLETCQQFQKEVPLIDRITAPAGTFNSGTNILAMLLMDNCYNFERKRKYTGRREKPFQWQVPWGKHFPATSRYKHFANKYEEVNQSNIMPIVTIRDPYTWMQSMCRQNYDARFEHAKSTCPNIIPYPSDIEAHPRFGKMKYMPVNIKYTQGFTAHFDSLPQVWNDWYNEYYETVDYPRLIVRMEDLLFRAEDTVTQICNCVGGTMHPHGFMYFKDVANQNHGIEIGQSVHHGLLRSLVKYGNKTTRRLGYPDFQLEAARDLLDTNLMEYFGYTSEPLSNETQT